MAGRSRCAASAGLFEEGWPERFNAESWRPEDWIGSWNAAFQAASAYDRVRKLLDVRTRDALDRILSAFFWEGGTVPPDLVGLEPSEGISNVLSPGTVAGMADLADSLDLETLRAPFAKRCRLDQDGWLRSFEDFRDYLKQWLDMLRGARDSGKAVVLWVA